MYFPKFDGERLDGDDPLTYDAATNTFTAGVSNDGTLIGEIVEYSVCAEFVDYPTEGPDAVAGAPTAETVGSIEFINPCIDPFSFTVPASQTNPAPNRYTDTDITFTLT